MPEARRRKSRGQSLVEFAISSTVLLLLAMGLIDLSRAFYYSVALQGAAREGARHAAWFNQSARLNPFLDDTEVINTVQQALNGAGLTAGQINFIAVNGNIFSGDALKAAIKDAHSNAKTEPIHLIVQGDTFVTTADLDYHDGERYPSLVRVDGTPDYLDDITKPLTTPGGFDEVLDIVQAACGGLLEHIRATQPDTSQRSST